MRSLPRWDEAQTPFGHSEDTVRALQAGHFVAKHLGPLATLVEALLEVVEFELLVDDYTVKRGHSEEHGEEGQYGNEAHPDE
jgi:hypothetical protein